MIHLLIPTVHPGEVTEHRNLCEDSKMLHIRLFMESKTSQSSYAMKASLLLKLIFEKWQRANSSVLSCNQREAVLCFSLYKHEVQI